MDHTSSRSPDFEGRALWDVLRFSRPKLHRCHEDTLRHVFQIWKRVQADTAVFGEVNGGRVLQAVGRRQVESAGRLWQRCRGQGGQRWRRHERGKLCAPAWHDLSVAPSQTPTSIRQGRDCALAQQQRAQGLRHHDICQVTLVQRDVAAVAVHYTNPVPKTVALRVVTCQAGHIFRSFDGRDLGRTKLGGHQREKPTSSSNIEYVLPFHTRSERLPEIVIPLAVVQHGEVPVIRLFNDARVTITQARRAPKSLVQP
mmetsp:Transcript_55644/g.180596  ORF Transcript_55644/g.180596 Transcript_55644/m.180596 type:complete len:256 (+) Transcript_55644:640-1407(+)